MEVLPRQYIVTHGTYVNYYWDNPCVPSTTITPYLPYVLSYDFNNFDWQWMSFIPQPSGLGLTSKIPPYLLIISTFWIMFTRLCLSFPNWRSIAWFITRFMRGVSKTLPGDTLSICSLTRESGILDVSTESRKERLENVRSLSYFMYITPPRLWIYELRSWEWSKLTPLNLINLHFLSKLYLVNKGNFLLLSLRVSLEQ